MDHVKIQISFIKNIDMDLKSIPNIWIWIGFFQNPIHDHPFYDQSRTKIL